MTGKFEVMGPLDMVRWINGEAAELDRMVSEYAEFEQDATYTILQRIKKFDETNPLIGHNVMISGDVIAPSMDDEALHGLMAPWRPSSAIEGSEQAPITEGLYGGYHLVSTYDPEKDDMVMRIAHMLIHQDLSITGMDAIGRLIRTTETTLVCANESEIEPVQPIDAHSLEDLYDDPVLKRFDSVMGMESLSRTEKLRMIGKIASSLFEGKELELDKNKQRASYMNATGLLTPKLMRTRDLMFGTKEILEGDLSDNNRMFSDVSKILNFYPKMLDWSYAYHRTSSTKAFVDKGEIDLYATGNLDTGVPVVAPLRSIIPDSPNKRDNI